MIFHKGDPYYQDLPGLSVIIGGMWVNNLAYWGCNQYIIQRALGANLKTARNGLLFAAFLKLLVPVIVVLPGITMFVLHKNGMFQKEMMPEGVIRPDHAYPTLMNLLPPGLKGVAFAALTAAVVASLAGKANSISTIFSLDIYKKYFKKDASEKQLVGIGKWVVIVAMGIAALIAPALKNLDQAYQFIQEYVGFISPGVLAIFPARIFLEEYNSCCCINRQPPDDPRIHSIEISSGMDERVFSGLSFPGPDDDYFSNHCCDDDCGQFAETGRRSGFTYYRY